MKETHPESSAEEIAALRALANQEIKRLQEMPQPIVRVCGPLTADGPEHYEAHAKRLEDAERILKAKGLTVWTFGEAEEEIFGKGYDHGNIFHYFHKPVLESGLIQTAYFLPRSDESNGATLERHAAEELGIGIEEFPEEWF